MCGYNVAALNVTRARRDSIGVKVFYRVYFGEGEGEEATFLHVLEHATF